MILYITGKYDLGDWVQKRSGGQWHGRIVGGYSTDLTSTGYAVESYYEPGSVQIYPEKALEPWTPPNEDTRQENDGQERV